MALPTIEETKHYLRVDGAEDDALISSLISVAQEDLTNSGVTNQDTERYGLAIKLMVANFYEERRPQVVGTSVGDLRFSLERIIMQLKAEELPPPDEDVTT